MPHPDNTDPAAAASEFLVELRNRVAMGESAYGDPKGPRALAKLAMLDAQIAFRREQGLAPPAPPPPEQAVREQHLNAAFPGGEPGPLPEHIAEHHLKRLEAIAQLGDEAMRARADATAADLAERTSPTSDLHSRFDRAAGKFPVGSEVAKGLFAEALPVLRDLVKDDPASSLSDLGGSRPRMW